MQTDLIDRIYECSVQPELWPGVLDSLSERTDSRGGLLFSANKALHWTASDTVAGVFDEYVKDGWFARCDRRVCLMSRAEPSFFIELDFWTEDQLKREPIYRDFFVPHGLGWSAGTGLQIPTGDNIVFSVERDYARGPVEPEYVAWLNALRPHLARAAFVTSRLQMQRAKGAADALTALDMPAMLVSEDGRLIEANARMESLSAAVKTGAAERVRLTDGRADDRLGDALAAIRLRDGAAPQSFPLRDENDRPVAVVHVMPVTRSAHDVFGQGHALLMFTPVAAARRPSWPMLRSLFDLTPSEARVATGLATGKSLEEIAAEGEVAMTTVRTQLRRVLEKTGCARQAEVAALFANIAVGPAGETR